MRTHLTGLLTLMFVGVSLASGQAPAEPASGEAVAAAPKELSPPTPDGQVLDNATDAPGAEAWIEPYQKPQRFWARAEYLLWGIKDSNFPALVSTGPSTDPRPGSLDSASTRVLFGGPNLSNRDRSGGRFFGGWCFGDQNQFGVQAGYFFLGDRSVGTFQASPGNPVLARPFFNANANLQDSSLIAFPGLASGSVKVDVPSFLQGAEANLTAAVVQRQSFGVEVLAGFRYMNLQEGLHIAENVQVSTSSPVFPGNQILITDAFDTHNNFYGGQLGARAEFRRKRWFVNVLAKAALGDANQVVAIHGFTTINTQPATAANAGLLAVASNSGHFTRDNFAVVPEVDANVGFQFTQRIRGFIGYSFLYWSRVARPGDQVDTAVNVNQVPTSATYGVVGGQPRPQFVFHSTDFWAQGINFGLEFRF